MTFNGTTWRLIDSGVADPAYTMAVDEALLLKKVQAKADPNVPVATLHLYSRDPPAVSLGYFQKVGDEIRVEREPRSDHMVNFINSIRGTEKPHLDALTGYKTQVAIALSVLSYREKKVKLFDPVEQEIAD